jgi:predicted Zn-dependent protease
MKRRQSVGGPETEKHMRKIGKISAALAGGAIVGSVLVAAPNYARAGDDAGQAQTELHCHGLRFSADETASLRSAASSARAAGCDLGLAAVDFGGKAELAIPKVDSWVAGHFDRVAPDEDVEVAVYRTSEDHLVAMDDGVWTGSGSDVAEAKAAMAQSGSVADSALTPSPAEQGLLDHKRMARAALGDQLTSTGSAVATTGKCGSDASYVLKPPYPKTEWSAGTWWIYWYYNPSGQPTDMNSDNVKSRVNDAPDNWEYNENNCDITNWPNFTQVPMGNTSVSPNQTASVCVGAPSVNVVGWKNWGTTTTTLADECTWGSGSNVTFSIAINGSYNYRAAASVSGCTASTDLEAVLTHEWGHALGLNHISANNQVMNPYINACDDRDRYIGRGDFKGVKAIYGVF